MLKYLNLVTWGKLWEMNVPVGNYFILSIWFLLSLSPSLVLIATGLCLLITSTKAKLDGDATNEEGIGLKENLVLGQSIQSKGHFLNRFVSRVLLYSLDNVRLG